MKEVNKEVLKDAANRLLFEMSEEEYDTLLNEFDIVKAQLSMIGKIPGIDEVEPMTFPFECTTDYLREDVPSATLSVEEVLQNSKVNEDNQIRIPKVVK